MDKTPLTKEEIFFHVGTSKTGTTYLQHRVFAKLVGVHYIHTSLYKKAIRLIKTGKHKRYLVSREFDRQLEQEVKIFSQSFPHTKPIIVFRRQDSYIASQYRRSVKNGYQGSFNDFFNLEKDTGHFKKEHLDYIRQIKILEQYFTPTPLVLFYDDLRENPQDFVLKLAQALDTRVDLAQINFEKKHTSYTEKQLKTIFAAGKYIDLNKKRIFKSNLLHFLWRLYLGSIRYTILHGARLIPSSSLSEKPLIPKEELQAVRNYFSDNWQQTLSYAKKSTPEN